MRKCFLTGVDINHEWMLPWWVDNIKKYNSTDIMICDYGMSAKMSEWAQSNSNYFLKYPVHNKCAWFYKVQSLFDSPYEQTCWLDADCQVLTNIECIFNFCEKDKVGLTKDPIRGPDWWATGVILIEGLSILLQDWNSECLKANTRGDQEALYELLEKNSIITNKYIFK